ncbi:hypothetical protein ZIOFF_066218 [Zingiber officinale]|uniref:Upf1 domain-containing protein n=1 Tax=Zingiber officinale TaxID=94328 RepID=A0A8J5F2K9_ZINOF|nr:hypothetical protein ZIOFF_066218 [Zingiber officinale]
MAAQSDNNLYETASQPDTGGHAYTFLEFNTQDDFDDYMEFEEFSQPSRSPAGPHLPPPSEPEQDSAASELHAPEPTLSPSASTPLGGPSSSSEARGASGGQAAAAAVDTLAAGMSELNFEETGDEGYEFGEGNLTEHACRYCGVQDPGCVVRCNVPTCRKWFCQLWGNACGSHIVNHLVLANHMEVCLHKDSPLRLGETIECHNCGCRNVFLLGFTYCRTGGGSFLCRELCSNDNSTRGMNWDLSQWRPLIEDGCFLPWLVKVPSEQEQLRAWQISDHQINKLEELWKNDEPQPVSLKYGDISQFIKFEEDFNKFGLEDSDECDDYGDNKELEDSDESDDYGDFKELEDSDESDDYGDNMDGDEPGASDNYDGSYDESREIMKKVVTMEIETEQEQLRAWQISDQQINKLEELRKKDEPTHVSLKYEDVYQFIKLEDDSDQDSEECDDYEDDPHKTPDKKDDHADNPNNKDGDGSSI